jgi:hypothetical protein
MTRMYGRHTSQLVKEINSSEAGQLAPFNAIALSVPTFSLVWNLRDCRMLLPASICSYQGTILFDLVC